MTDNGKRNGHPQATGNGNGHANGNGTHESDLALRPFRVVPAEDQLVALDHLSGSDLPMVTEPAPSAPAVDGAATPRPPLPPEPGVLRQARNWSELRQSRFGLRPLVLLTLLSLPGLLLEQTFGVSGGIAVPDMARDLGINLSNVINIIIVAYIVALFGAIVVGWWADRHPRTPLVGLGAIASGILAVLSGGASSVFTLGTFRAGGNVAQAAGSVPTFSLLADYYEPKVRGKVFALQGVLGGIAALAAPLIVGGMVTWIGWRTTFRLLGIPLIVVGVLALVLLREPVRGYFERRELGADEEVARQEDEPQSFGEAWRTIWAVRTLRRLFISEMASKLPALTYAIFFPFYLAEKYHLNAFERGLITLPGAAATIVGAYLGGGLIDLLLRRNPGRVITVAAAFGGISSLGVIGSAFEPPLWVLITATAFFGFGFALVGPALN
jgi:MFS family permease